MPYTELDLSRPERIKRDPQASREELLWLRSQDPLAVLVHPNCPPELWWNIAEKYPLEARESILFSLLTLENPAAWDTIESKYIERWIREAIYRLPPTQHLMFAIECAERFLTFFTREFPEDHRPTKALDVYRRYLRGEATTIEANLARHAALEAAEAASARNALIAEAAAYTVAWAIQSAERTTKWATRTMECTVDQVFEALFFVRLAERRWQWARLQGYLKEPI